MRVLHVVASGQRRGAEIFAADLVGALAEAGVDQRVAVLRPAGGGQGLRFPATTDIVGAGGRRVPVAGVEVAAVRRLRAVVANWTPDVLQVHGGESLKHAVAALAPGRRPPIVYRRIGSAPPWITRGARRFSYAWLLRRAARVVAVAEAVRRETLELFRLPTEKVVTIPNGVDARRLTASADRSAVCQRLRIPPDAGVVLSLGALTWEKDPHAHLEITAPILAGRDDVIHLVAGDGPLRDELEAAVHERGLSGRVRLLGSRSDVADLLAAADVLLFASHAEGMEGMPAIVIEAGMAGLAVAGYSVAGVNEVVETGETGLLVPPMRHERLTEAVAALLEDGERRLAMGRAARARCCARFEIGVVAPQYLRVYQELVPAEGAP
jgi:glycosyltransferase involved in cell wall biosynthesis